MFFLLGQAGQSFWFALCGLLVSVGFYFYFFKIIIIIVPSAASIQLERNGVLENIKLLSLPVRGVISVNFPRRSLCLWQEGEGKSLGLEDAHTD